MTTEEQGPADKSADKNIKSGKIINHEKNAIVMTKVRRMTP